MTHRFPSVSCSQCGRSFGPGDHGFSHCHSHNPLVIEAIRTMAALTDDERRFVILGFPREE